jgi:hypothetical protein
MPVRSRGASIAAMQALYIQAWKTGKEKLEPTTASNIRGHATPSMPQTMPIPRQLSQDKKVCASEDGNETPQEETARKQTPEQTTARPRMNSPLFIRPCCAVDQKELHARRTRKTEVTEMCPFQALSSINRHTSNSLSVVHANRTMLRDPAWSG